MITKENFEKEIDSLIKKKLLDPVALDIKNELKELIEFYDDAKEVKDICETAFELLNENVELHKKNDGITDDDSVKEAEKANKLKLIQIRARARARALKLRGK